MRSLRVLGLADGVPGASRNLLLEDPASGEQFSTRCDERLLAATRGDLSRFGQSESASESQLRPAEIQARIRAGATVEQIAALAGTSLSRVERFAYPVLLERASVVERALKARPAIDGITGSASVAETVAATLAARGHDSSIHWDAYKDDDGWVLALTWSAGRSENQAHWLFHPGAGGGTLSARDEAAAEIVDPALRILRPLRQVRPEVAAPALLDPTAPTESVHRPSEAASRSAHPAGGKLRSPAARIPEMPHPRSTSGSTPFGRQPLPTSLAGGSVAGGVVSGGVVSGGVVASGNAERVLIEPLVADRVTEDLLQDERSGVTPAALPVEVARTGTEPVGRPLPALSSGSASSSGSTVSSPLAAAPAVAAAPVRSAEVAAAVVAPTAAAPIPAAPAAATRPSAPARPTSSRSSGPVPGTARAAKRGTRPTMPSWEDVLLGTRSDKTAGR